MDGLFPLRIIPYHPFAVHPSPAFRYILMTDKTAKQFPANFFPAQFSVLYHPSLLPFRKTPETWAYIFCGILQIYFVALPYSL